MDRIDSVQPGEDPGWELLRAHLGITRVGVGHEGLADTSEHSLPTCCSEASRRWLHDRCNGAFVCSGCGTSRPGVMHTGWMRYSRRSIYDPLYHWHERLKMAKGEDTKIPTQEFNRIREAIYRRIGRRRIGQRRDVRAALQSLDRQDGTRYWAKKWLERWPQIIIRIYGDRIRLLRVDIPPGILDDMFLATKFAWQKVRCKFRPRTHMPNYSYMFVQILSFFGIPPEETLPWFHQLKTKIKNAERYWMAICAYRKWPFVSLIPKLRIKDVTNVKRS